MASTSSALLHLTPLTRSHRASSSKLQTSALPNRRQSLFLFTALTAVELQAKAEDIPLFGLRKRLKKVEEVAEEIVKEGVETAEKGIETAEKGIEKAEEIVKEGVETAEKGIETAEKGIETAVGFGNVAQAGVVVGAEVVGVLVATSVVNGILGPEGQRS